MVFTLLSAAFLTISGSVSLYMASRNQRLSARPLPGRLCIFTGVISLGTALLFLLHYSGAATSVFILMTGVMLVWTILPMVLAYVRHPRGHINE